MINRFHFRNSCVISRDFQCFSRKMSLVFVSIFLVSNQIITALTLTNKIHSIWICVYEIEPMERKEKNRFSLVTTNTGYTIHEISIWHSHKEISFCNISKLNKIEFLLYEHFGNLLMNFEKKQCLSSLIFFNYISKFINP